MDPDFWLTKWRANEIGFHQTEIHPLLADHWAGHWPPLNALRVLVPLCGKSRDLVWLRERGHVVIGFELSPIAVEAFFAEQGLRPLIVNDGPFTRYEAGGITIYCGDFFQASTERCGSFTAVYDRAALIALASEQRDTYAATLRRLCLLGARGLLITVEYPLDTIAAPPFSIEGPEVMARFTPWSEVSLLERRAAEVKGRPALELAYEFVVGAN
ncbi:MAG: thiopurine S-methyltransferase [Gammaproteobacteria bacterium]